MLFFQGGNMKRETRNRFPLHIKGFKPSETLFDLSIKSYTFAS